MQARKPSATDGYLLHLREATNNSFPQLGLNIRGKVLTMYLKRLSIGLFSERLSWATNLQNPVIRERFPGLSVNRGEVINTPWSDPCVKGIKQRDCLSLSVSLYIYLYIRISGYSLNDVTVIRLRFHAVFHSHSKHLCYNMVSTGHLIPASLPSSLSSLQLPSASSSDCPKCVKVSSGPNSSSSLSTKLNFKTTQK